MRGTFANIRIKNFIRQRTDGVVPEGGLHETLAGRRGNADLRGGDEISGRRRSAGRLRRRRIWQWLLARLGGQGHANCLGVRAVIAESFERIHRSNLVGMGVLPLTFEPGTSWKTLGLKGDEEVTIHGLGGTLKPRQTMEAEITYCRWQGGESAVALPHRDARRTRIFQQRRHSSLRAAPARGSLNFPTRLCVWREPC